MNVVLPFARAWGNRSGDAGLSAAALALYRAWPPLQENAVTRRRPGCWAAARTSATARGRQQGLIRVYKRRLGREGA